MQRAPDRESPGFFEDLVKKYDSIWETFILPERTTYNQEALGPQTQRINAKTLFTREDNVSTNIRGEKIVYSFFKVQKSGTEQDLSKDVCLVYLHSHGGNMVEGLSLLKFAGELGLNFCCFDFAGSGKSEGKYTTLGLRESEDCRQIIEVLMKKHGMRSFVLWGRSMGAVAALLYASGEQPHIKYMVLDSPFSDVEQMVRDAGNSYISLGEYLAMFLFNMVKNDIKEHVGQDLGNFKPIRFCQSCKVPCLFMVGKNDPLVLPNRVEEMFTAYIGDKKEFMLLEGTHSSGRSMTDIEEAFRKIDKIFRTGFATKSKVEHPVASSYVTQSRSIAEKLNFIGGEIQRQENKSNLQRPKIQLRERVKENILHPKDFNYVTLREVNPIDSSKHLQASLNCPPGFKEDSLNPNSQDFSMINPTTRPKALSQMNSARQALANPKQPLYFRHGQPKTETEIHHPSSKNFIQEFKENINSGNYGSHERSHQPDMQNTGWSRPMPYVKHDVMAKKPSHTSFVHSERSSPGNKLFNKPFVDPMEGRGERRSSFQTLERIDRGPNLSQHRPNPSCNITGLYSPGIPRESMLRQNSPFLVPRTQNMQPETPTRIMTSDLQAINELQTRKDLGHQISSSDQLREALKRRLRQKTDSEKSNGSKQYLDNSPQQALQIMKSNSITEISLQSTLNYNTQGAQGAQNSSTRRPPRQFRIFDDEDEDPSLHKAAYLSSQLLHINLAPSAAKQTLRSDRPIHLGNNMRHFPN